MLRRGRHCVNSDSGLFWDVGPGGIARPSAGLTYPRGPGSGHTGVMSGLTDEEAMEVALAHAEDAATWGDVPIGAVVLSPEGEVLAVAGNRREADGDPTGHAEILALRAAGLIQEDWRLNECTLVVTLEPCTMCAGAIVLARIRRLVLGAWDEKAGACGSTRDVVRDARLNHQVSVTGGVLADRSRQLLSDFFASRRLNTGGRQDEEAPEPVG